MRFLFKLLALLFGFAVVGLIGLSVVSILVAIVMPSLVRENVALPTVSRPSTSVYMESEVTAERGPGDGTSRESATSRRPGVSVTVQPAPNAAGTLKATRPARVVSGENDGIEARMSPNVNIVELVAVSGFVGVMTIAVVGAMCIGALKVLRGGASKKSRAAEAEEAMLMQQIHAGLIRMEQRVDALETLLLDKDKSAAERARK